MENPDQELVCLSCGATIKDEDDVCYKCGSDLMEYDEKTIANNKYPSLKNLSSVCKFLVFIVFISALASVYFGWDLLSDDNLQSVGIFLIVYSFTKAILSIIILLAVSEGILLMIDMENNSRVHSRLLYTLINNKNR